MCAKDCTVMPRVGRMMGVAAEFEYLRSGQVCMCVYMHIYVCERLYCDASCWQNDGCGG